MEFFVFLLVLAFLFALVILAFGGAALAADDDRPTEKSIRDAGKETRAKIDTATHNHKQQTFDYLYSKHQEAVEEALHE